MLTVIVCSTSLMPSPGDTGTRNTAFDQAQRIGASSAAVAMVLAELEPCTAEYLQVDPSQLTSPSPGKLVRYTIPDGGSVAPDQSYAEVEV